MHIAYKQSYHKNGYQVLEHPTWGTLIGRNNQRSRPTDAPIDENLFLKFAALKYNVGSLIYFANKYGLITEKQFGYISESRGVMLNMWYQHIAKLRFIKDLYSACLDGNQAYLMQYIKLENNQLRIKANRRHHQVDRELGLESALIGAKDGDFIPAALWYCCEAVNRELARTDHEPNRQYILPEGYVLVPKDLISYFYACAARMIADKKILKRCKYCKNLYMKSNNGDSKRSKYCSRNCKYKAQNLRRARAD